jgi:glutathione peroxidase
MNQEPGDNDEILNTLKYVRPGNGFVPGFPLTQKMDVNGFLQNVLWTSVKSSCPAPQSDLADVPPSWSPVRTTDVAWNFETVLVARDGRPFRRYSSAVDPMLLTDDIQFLLAQPSP